MTTYTPPEIIVKSKLHGLLAQMDSKSNATGATGGPTLRQTATIAKLSRQLGRPTYEAVRDKDPMAYGLRAIDMSKRTASRLIGSLIKHIQKEDN